MIGGRRLEEEVYDCLSALLSNGLLGLDPKCTVAFRGRSYFSRDRSSDIRVDVSLEVTLPGASDPSLVWVWECKDYGKRVPIDDVEEFDAKLQQIGANNTKGTVVTRNGFQRAAINYARNRKIGLARYIASDKILTNVLHSIDNYESYVLDEIAMDGLSQAVHPGQSDIGLAGVDLAGGLTTAQTLGHYIAGELFNLLPARTVETCDCCLRHPPSNSLEEKFLLFSDRNTAEDERPQAAFAGIPFCWRFWFCNACFSLFQRRRERTSVILTFVAGIVPILAAWWFSSWWYLIGLLAFPLPLIIHDRLAQQAQKQLKSRMTRLRPDTQRAVTRSPWTRLLISLLRPTVSLPAAWVVTDDNRFRRD
jgi:restriction endonuclease